MTTDELAAKILADLGIARHMIGAFSVPPHSPNVIVAGEFMTSLLTAVNMAAVNAISERVRFRNSYVVDISEMVGECVHADGLWKIVDPSKILRLQLTQTFFRCQ
jgi:hypothetical protein